MKKIILLLVLLLISFGQALWMKRIVFLNSGTNTANYISCKDTDNDSMNEIIFSKSTQVYPVRRLWEIWEYSPINQYELAFTDTGPAQPYPPGISTGNFGVEDAGDIDQDSLTDLLGPNVEQPNNPDTIYNVITTQESPSYFNYPESLTWWYRHTNNAAISQPFYFPPDLDSDNRNEIMFVTYPPLGVVIFENVTNNQNVVVWNTTQGLTAWSFAFGDFDLDSRKEFVTSGLEISGRVYIYENSGDNQYEQIWIDTVRLPNGSDVFSGNDLDRDGKPEFFVSFAQWVSGNIWDFFLYMWEATGNNTYERTHIATIRAVDWLDKRSKCGDIDGDGIEELVWSIGAQVIVYKATGNNQFERIWTWNNDHGGDFPHSMVNIYDMNRNGYNEIVVSGWYKTSIFEVEAVWLRRPNGREIFIGNTQEQIRWQKFYPPRCDSLSLFYSLNNGRTYDTIITGLSGVDSTYLWTVPDTSSDSCKVKIIAYGPGWQYDESDRVFSIVGTGINETALPNLAITRIELYPNPAGSFLAVRLSPTIDHQMIKMFDVMGKVVSEIASPSVRNDSLKEIKISLKGINAGIYFLRVDKEIKKFIITK